MKILIIHTWGIGDLIMFASALKLLRQNYPKAQIDILIADNPGAAELLEERETVDKIVKFNWRKKNFFEKLKMILQLRKEKYDWALVTGWTNPLKGGLLAFLTGAKNRVGTFKERKSPFYTYQVPGIDTRPRRETNLDLIKAMGIEAKEIPPPFFEFKQEDKEFAQDFLRKINCQDKILLGFHPGADPVHYYLLWPKDYFIELGKKIAQNYGDARILLFGGSEEKGLCQEIKDRIGEKAFLATDLTLKQVAALMSRCRIFTASDSGLGHMATATEANLIIIFGPSEAKLYAPKGSKITVFEEKCQHLYQDIVHTCLKKITPQMVFEEIERILPHQKKNFKNKKGETYF